MVETLVGIHVVDVNDLGASNSVRHFAQDA